MLERGVAVGVASLAHPLVPTVQQWVSFRKGIPATPQRTYCTVECGVAVGVAPLAYPLEPTVQQRGSFRSGILATLIAYP